MTVFKNLGVNAAERETNRLVCSCGRKRNQYSLKCPICDISAVEVVTRYQLDFNEIKDYLIAIDYPNAAYLMSDILDSNSEYMDGNYLPLWLCDENEQPEYLALYQKIKGVWKLPSDVEKLYMYYDY